MSQYCGYRPTVKALQATEVLSEHGHPGHPQHSLSLNAAGGTAANRAGTLHHHPRCRDAKPQLTIQDPQPPRNNILRLLRSGQNTLWSQTGISILQIHAWKNAPVDWTHTCHQLNTQRKSPLRSRSGVREAWSHFEISKPQHLSV